MTGSPAHPIAMFMGAGPSAQSFTDAASRGGSETIAYLNRPSGHYGAMQRAAHAYCHPELPDPAMLVARHAVDLVVPMSIDWHWQSWAQDLIASPAAIFSPRGEAMRLERERSWGMQLADQQGIPVPRWHVAADRQAALEILASQPHPWVIKNPLCSPGAPLHTIVSMTAEQTRLAIEQADDSEGIFMQEFVGKVEIGHIALVSAGRIFPLVTNQEYKWSEDGNRGSVLGDPLGGIVIADLEDRFALAELLLRPLEGWLRETGFCGPLQVTAGLYEGDWHVLEYNVRLGVSSGPLLLTMLENPIETLLATARGEKPHPRFRETMDAGVLLAIGAKESALGTPVPDEVPDDDQTWWGDVKEASGSLRVSGPRPFSFAAFGPSVEECRHQVYRHAGQLDPAQYRFRSDIARSLWPVGCE